MAKRGRPKGTTALRKRVDALIHSKGTIDQFVLLTDIVEVFGGPRAMAVSMHEEYNKAPAGGIARQKFWQMVQHLVIRSTEMNLTKVRDATQMSDDEINEALGDYLGRIKDGSVVSPSAPPGQKAAAPAGLDTEDGEPDFDED